MSATPEQRGWRFFVDRGGTFTDVVAVDPAGALHVRKVLSAGLGAGATLAAIREIRGESPEPIEAVRMGTTVATNALLERRGAPVALAITKGFADLLRIGTQQRPRLFSLRIERPEPIPKHVIEVDERVLAGGELRRGPDPAALARDFAAAREAGCEAVAVSLVHAWRDPGHELAVAAAARDAGFPLVVLGSECDPEPGFLARTETTVVDAHVTPPLRRHVSELREALGGADLRLMTSGGGLVGADSFRGRDAVLSGPAGGAVALAAVAGACGCDEALGLDMGGTSTDVSRWSRSHDVGRARERQVAGLRLRAPMVDVVTIAAGGGSVLSRIGGRLVAGPRSAGARPGPAGHRLGGPATVTDANVVLGRVLPQWFPRCLGESGDRALDAEASRRALAELGRELGVSAEEAALGAFRVANESMARALRQVSVARGRDPETHALVAFGGAAPQHACALASLLGMKRILLHPLAGVLSAVGMGLAPARAAGSRALLLPLDEAGVAAAATALEELESEQLGRLGEDGVPEDARRAVRFLDVRHAGVEEALAVRAGLGLTAAALRESLEAKHERLFGFRREALPAEIVAARVEATGTLEPPQLPVPAAANGACRPVERSVLLLPDAAGSPAPWDVPVFRRADLLAGHALDGPAIIASDTETIVIDPGWGGAVLPDGTIELSREAGDARPAPARAAARLEVLGSRFMGIAEQMGEALRRTAQSPNMKERLDFSCAIFTRDGRLVANAPHVPVHLGAMGETVRSLLASRGEEGLGRGMALVSNDPHRGGSHLPDVTVVTPVFGRDGTLRAFVACRGHHADVGGIEPGSMPPFATSLREEGVVLHDEVLVEDGRFREAEIASLLAAGPWPVRGIAERLADLRAQAAANAVGERLLGELGDELGDDETAAAMEDVLADAAAATREMLRSLPQGTRRFADEMDDGARIEVAITLRDGTARFDFAGTSPQVAGSLNAPRAVVRACVLYAVRCLLGRDVPLNDGVLEPVEIAVPEGSLLWPGPDAAVCGGNVETSMRIADVVLAALGAQAASQGTMNNVALGTSSSAHYETLGGGSGAGPGFDGADAVHSHLTNTRLTDVEVLERRMPVVVRSLSVREGSGGAGLHRGGCGLVRELELREPLHVSLLTERRTIPPFGLDGGGPGAVGENVLVRGGSERDLGGKASFHGEPGDVIIVRTPGGGGHGAPPAGGPGP